jgi:lysophospholipase L1-like esterase
LAAICALALGGEWFARSVLGLGDPPLSITHPRIEYMYAPNQDVLRFGKRFLINGYGMRSAPFAVRKGPDELRVLVFGDSVVNGGNLRDHDDLATTLLTYDLLPVAGGKKVVVGNVSAGSWGPGNWLAYSQTYGFFDADVVVLVASSHDVGDNPTFAPLDPNTHPTKKPLLALTEGMTRYLPRYLPAFLIGQPAPEGGATQASPTITDRNRAQGLDDLRTFLLAARDSGAAVLVVQWPEREEVAAGVPEDGFADLTGLARELGMKNIVAAPSVAAALDQGHSVYRDNIHPNDEGQKVLADLLRRELEPLIRGTKKPVEP